MNQKTEPLTTMSESQHAGEFSPGLVRWMVTLTILTLCFVFLRNYAFNPNVQVYFVPHPWITAGGLLLQQGLSEFGGREPEVASLAIRLGMLFGFLLGFVLAPVTFFFSWRKQLLEPKKKGVTPSNVGFVVGGVIFLYYVLSVVIATPIQHEVSDSLHEALAVGENRDAIIGGLTFIGYDAYQYKTLPRSLGGGSGSYSGYDIPDRLEKSEDATYQIVAISDTSITLAGVSLTCDGALVQGTYGRDGQLKGTFEFQGEFQ